MNGWDTVLFHTLSLFFLEQNWFLKDFTRQVSFYELYKTYTSEERERKHAANKF